jgi:cell division protein FtsB
MSKPRQSPQKISSKPKALIAPKNNIKDEKSSNIIKNIATGLGVATSGGLGAISIKTALDYKNLKNSNDETEKVIEGFKAEINLLVSNESFFEEYKKNLENEKKYKEKLTEINRNLQNYIKKLETYHIETEEVIEGFKANIQPANLSAEAILRSAGLSVEDTTIKPSTKIITTAVPAPEDIPTGDIQESSSLNPNTVTEDDPNEVQLGDIQESSSLNPNTVTEDDPNEVQLGDIQP